jgi:thiosulfate/3-mercaptopyruvate sulfurtransferase
MERQLLMVMVSVLALALVGLLTVGANAKPAAPPLTPARAIFPIISTDWLGKNINDPKLIIIDVRKSEEYKAGHIPNAINIPAPKWFVTRNELLLELPEEADLYNTIGSAGIKSDSIVVIVTKTDHPYPIADATRVAVTLLYAGIKNVAILDGGNNKWVKEGRPVSDEIVKPTTVAYKGKVNKAMFVSKEYVLKKIGKSVIVDARDPNVYFGVVKEPFTERSGHIPSAKCLPTPWFWTEEGTYKNVDELRKMAFGVVGKDASKEIIVYCGVGGYASTSWFVLVEVLGYKNVKIYDGSAQEWTRDAKAPVVLYKWE